ncbi:ParB/RepB/Spo0J family partition protein [Amylibacter sp. IMCC11727]|uniref:ParB/RepB/Spo0J family partition protein n=1 Tax=Amylibacter sp. IMCC11727 TaxID=3039851 RepID=UPI00244E054D|nr:ParB/RepB/Spo0J family partition protein [Amylibacter sp. IMCC11727]WGI21810.1 ParB/RepB/Spo0J family partition protein [Amylibacter sp. IMCC11727]
MTKHTQINTAEAIAAENAIGSFDLSLTYLSDLNPRQVTDPEEDKLMADSLVSCGLIQNLSGLLDAEGRRWRGLNIAMEQKPELANVPIRITRDPALAEAWANVENSQRADLHPAQEIRAFGKMYNTNPDVARIAKVFGVTEKHVYRRLALSKLADPILDALQAGEINLTMAAAFTTSDDEARSLEVLEQVKGYAESAQRMKTLLKPHAIKENDRRAIFVGKDAYKAAGGVLGGDLFDDTQTFDDPDLLQRLFQEALDAKAAEIAEQEGWKWVDTTDDPHYMSYEAREAGYKFIYKVQGVLSEDQANRMDELSELAESDVLDEDGQAELAALEAIVAGEFTNEQKAHAGARIFIRHNGEVDGYYGLIAREDQDAAAEAGIIEKVTKAKSDAPNSPYSQKLLTDLNAIKLAAMQNAALDHGDYLLDLLAFHFSGMAGFQRVFNIRREKPNNRPDTATGFGVDERLNAGHDHPDDMWNVDLVEAFEAFQAKGKKHRNAEITRHLVEVLTGGNDDFVNGVRAKVGASTRSVWTPTAENFFGRVSAPYLVALYQDLLDLNASDPEAVKFAALKKGEKAAHMEDLFAKADTQAALKVTGTQKARIDAWVPDCIE